MPDTTGENTSSTCDKDTTREGEQKVSNQRRSPGAPALEASAQYAATSEMNEKGSAMLEKAAPLTARRSSARSLLVVGVGLIGTLGIAGPASAAAPVPFTMADQVNFNSGVFTFTATRPLCASGTFVDDVKVAAFAHSDQARSGRSFVLIRSTYTCDDGSGTFQMLKHLTLTFTESGFTDAGPVEILGGSGAYAGITGHGFTSGGTDAESGIGGGTTTGVVQLP